MNSGQLSPEQLRLVAKLAWLYYEEGLNQPAIAKRLNIAQARVSRLLKLAEDVGIVRTVVQVPQGVHVDLERELENRYGLSEVAIAETGLGTDISRTVGAAAGAYLEATLVSGERVGISSWSSTLYAAIESMSAKPKAAADVLVQLLGGVGTPESQVLATQMASRFSKILGADLILVQAPGVVNSEAARDVLLAEPYMERVRDAWRNLTTALVGIGSIKPSPLLLNSGNSIDDETLRHLADSGAVGDVCLHYFDQNGKLVSYRGESSVLGISPEELLNVPRRIGVAGGPEKLAAIRAAITGGWVNALVTDEQTAIALAN